MRDEGENALHIIPGGQAEREVLSDVSSNFLHLRCRTSVVGAGLGKGSRAASTEVSAHDATTPVAPLTPSLAGFGSPIEIPPSAFGSPMQVHNHDAITSFVKQPGHASLASQADTAAAFRNLSLMCTSSSASPPSPQKRPTQRALFQPKDSFMGSQPPVASPPTLLCHEGAIPMCEPSPPSRSSLHRAEPTHDPVPTTPSPTLHFPLPPNTICHQLLPNPKAPGDHQPSQGVTTAIVSEDSAAKQPMAEVPAKLGEVAMEKLSHIPPVKFADSVSERMAPDLVMGQAACIQTELNRPIPAKVAPGHVSAGLATLSEPRPFFLKIQGGPAAVTLPTPKIKVVTGALPGTMPGSHKRVLDEATYSLPLKKRAIMYGLGGWGAQPALSACRPGALKVTKKGTTCRRAIAA